jgi:hypothetical protein
LSKPIEKRAPVSQGGEAEKSTVPVVSCAGDRTLEDPWTQSLVSLTYIHELKILKDSKDRRTSGLAGMGNCGVITISTLRMDDISDGLNAIVADGKLSRDSKENVDWGGQQS